MPPILVKVQPSDIPANDYPINRVALRAIDDDRAFFATEQWLFGSDNPDLIGSRGTQMARQLRVTSLTGGSGYTSPPTITCSDGSRAEAILSGGAVALLNFTHVVPGTTAPTVTFTGGGGSGAAATLARGSAPTLSAGFMTVASTATAGNAIISNIQMAAAQTVVVVCKRAAAGTAQIIIGTRQNTVSPVDGFNLWHASGTDAFFAQAATESQAHNIGMSAAAAGDWVGLSVSHAGVSSTRIATVGDSVIATKANVPFVASASSACIALGNSRFGAFAGGSTLDVAAMVVFPFGTTAEEQVLHLAKLRATLAERGITVTA